MPRWVRDRHEGYATGTVFHTEFNLLYLVNFLVTARLLDTANVHSSLIRVTLMMQAIIPPKCTLLEQSQGVTSKNTASFMKEIVFIAQFTAFFFRIGEYHVTLRNAQLLNSDAVAVP